MANYRIQSDGLQRLLTLALNEDGPGILQEWKAHLERGIVTDEMRAVFAARGWISSERDTRLQRETNDVSETTQSEEGEPLRETATEPRRGRNRRNEGDDETEAAVREAPDGTEEVKLRE